jgi:hypothetical protein
MPARLVVILTNTPQPTTAYPSYSYLLRADVPASRQAQYAKPGYVSAFVPMAPDSDPDAASLVSGAVVEQARTFIVQPSVSLATITAALAKQQVDYQAAVTSDATWARYGTYLDAALVWHPQGT